MTGTDLVRYDEACRAVGAAVAVDEVLEISHRADAVRQYARQAKNKDMEIQCAEIRIRAERRLGEILEAMDKNKGGNFSRAIDNPPEQIQAPDQFASLNNKPLTIEELGVDRHLNNRAQKLAAIPEGEYEEILGDWRERVAQENERVTTNLLNAGRKAVKGTFGSGEHEWYTPPKYIERVRTALGAIDLDPASSNKAQRFVQADNYFTAAQDGLAQTWRGRVFLNPPYSRVVVEAFVEKFVEEFQSGNMTAGVLLTNNATDTEWWRHASSFCSAVVHTPRIAFIHESKDEPEKPSPWGQTFFYFGKDIEAFSEGFGDLGNIMHRYGRNCNEL